MKSIDYNSPEYKRSRGAYMAQCTFEYFISILVADVFLAKLLSSIGISDALVGIISSFISMAFLIQILSIFLVKTRFSTKKLVILFDTISQLFFCTIYIVPFLPMSKSAKTAVVMMCIILAYVGKYLISSICFKWANSYVDPAHRATYSAAKEIISLIAGIAFSSAMGFIIDKYESIGNLNGGFLFIAASMLVINACNFVSLIMIKDEDKDTSGREAPFSVVLSETLGNKSFRSLLIMTVIWESARYFSVGFMGIFKTKDLLISVFTVQMINMAANIMRIFVSAPFGKFSDKNTFVKGFEMALVIAAAAFFINIFTTRSRWYLIVVHTILYNVSMAGTNQNAFNITYSYVKSEFVTQAMAIKYSIGGIFGFISSILGGKILSAVQESGNVVFGINLYGQQLLSAISFLLIVAAIIFTRIVLEKQKVLIQ